MNKRRLGSISLALLLLFNFHPQTTFGAGDYVTVKNDSGAMVNEGDYISFSGVSAVNATISVDLFYDIVDPNGVIKSTGNFIKNYTSDSREIYYQHQFQVKRTVFAKRGLYKIKVHFVNKSTGSKIDSKEFEVFVDITEKPLSPLMTLNPLPPTTASTVYVSLASGTGENPALGTLNFQYRTSIYEDWKPYTSAVPVTVNGTYVYGRACTAGGQCSKVGTTQISNVTATAVTPPTKKLAPTMYMEESRIANYYFVGFKRDATGANNVPVPSGTTPTP